MESQDDQHLPQEHNSQESVPEHREEGTLAAPAPAAFLNRLRLGRSSLLPEMDEKQLLATLESAEWQVRMAAVQKLGEYEKRAPIERLIRILNDEHEAVRAAAAYALGAIGNPKAIVPLVDALQDVTWLVRSAVVQALGRLGEQAPVEPLTVALHDEDESVRAVAVSALGTMGKRVPIELLLTALQDSAWQVREMALLALGVRGEDIPQATLIAALQDEDESVHRAVYFLQETYPDRFAETIEGIPASVSEENSGKAFNDQLQILRPAASSAEQQETYNGNPASSTDPGMPPLLFKATHELEQAEKREEGSNNLASFDDERGQQSAVPYHNPQHYPRRGTMRALRLALLFCWSIFLGYLVSVIWNLVQLTRVDLAQLTAQVAIQALLAPLTALNELNVPVWVRGVCTLLALLLFIGCLWAARDTWYEHMWARRQGVRGEELEVGSGDHDQFTRAPVKPPRQISTTRQRSRRAVLVGLTTVLIVGNSIAWSLLLNSKRKKGSSSLALGTVLYIDKRHSGNVRSVTWSPDSARVASGSDDKTVQVWDAASGSNSFTYSRHTSGVLTVAWSPDGSRIASAGDDGNVYIWDAATGRTVFTYRGHAGDTVVAVAWSPDSKRVVSACIGGSKVQVWDAANGDHSFTYTGGYPALTVAWSPDGSRIASAGDDGAVYIWDATTGRTVFINTFGIAWGAYQQSDPISAVAWSPDSICIASGSAGKTVRVWDASNGGHAYIYRGHFNAQLGFITSVAWSPDGTRIASGSYDRTVQVWDAANGGHVYIYRGHAAVVTTVAWSPDGAYIVSGSEDKTVQVWGAM